MTLACAAGTVLLLIPAMFEPFLATSVFGATRTSTLPSSATDFWNQGWPLLSATVFLFVLVFPFVRFGALIAVLTAVRRGARAPWLKIAFRIANGLETWAMLDVFFLGAVVAYARLSASIIVTVEVGALCFAGATVLSLLTRATLDKGRVWNLIEPRIASYGAHSSLMCTGCELLVEPQFAGRHCPRCLALVRKRRPYSLMMPIALLLSAFLLYFPANFLPIATIPIDFKPTSYTIFGGVWDLTQSRMMGLALLVFCASFVIPILKMAAMTWCTASSIRRSSHHLVAKTRVFRLIQEIGRWSMVDPFTIACFAPVMHFNGLVEGRAEPAATPFAAVVILTMLAVNAFDPRRMWDRAQVR